MTRFRPVPPALRTEYGLESGADLGDWQPSAADTVGALAERERLEAMRPAWAFATVWRHDIDSPGFTLPPLDLVEKVEYLIGEPVWTKRYYGTD